MSSEDLTTQNNNPTPTPDKPFNVRDTLNEHQLKLLDEFHEKVKEYVKTERERVWITDMNLCRYLRARDYDLPKSLDMIKETLIWRRSYKPHCIVAEDVLCELQNEGKMYRNGKDKFGRPILYMRPGMDNTGPERKEEKVKYLVYLMEKSIASMDESRGVEKLVWLIDYKDYGGKGASSSPLGMMKVAKEIVDILQNHYPERLGVAYMINAPWLFHAFWKMIRPFLQEVTAQKLHILGGKNWDQIMDIADPSMIEESFGGTNPFKFSFEEHGKKEDIEFPPVPKDADDAELGIVTPPPNEADQQQEPHDAASKDKKSKKEKKLKKEKSK